MNKQTDKKESATTTSKEDHTETTATDDPPGEAEPSESFVVESTSILAAGGSMLMPSKSVQGDPSKTSTMISTDQAPGASMIPVGSHSVTFSEQTAPVSLVPGSGRQVALPSFKDQAGHREIKEKGEHLVVSLQPPAEELVPARRVEEEDDEDNTEEVNETNETKRFLETTKGKVAVLVLASLLAAVIVVAGVCGSGLCSDDNGSDWDCTAVECRYTGASPVQGVSPVEGVDVETFLTADCQGNVAPDTVNPASSCFCRVNVVSPIDGGVFDCSLDTCRFVNADNSRGWDVAFDCSSFLVGECVGRDATNNCISVEQCFTSNQELRDAVQVYVLQDASARSLLASQRGGPIGSWCVDRINDFSEVFKELSTFNEDIGGWNVSSATDMEEMVSCLSWLLQFYTKLLICIIFIIVYGQRIQSRYIGMER